MDKKYGSPEFYTILDDLAELHSRKNKDYAEGNPEGPLGNFNRVSKIKKMYPRFDWSTPFGTAMDYMLKQLDAAFILYETQKGSVTGEPIDARLTDVAVYAVLGMILKMDEVEVELDDLPF
jgi:hypothetical protein